MNSLAELRYLAPELTLCVWSVLALALGLFPRGRRWCAWAAFAGCLAAAGALFTLSRSATDYHTICAGMLAWDPVARLFKWLALVVLGLVVLMAAGDRGVAAELHGEYYCLLMLVATGMMLLASAHHFLLVILAMELMSFCGYLLVAFQRQDPPACPAGAAGRRSSEAALKYFLFGALASGILLYGVALLYALTQALDFAAIRVAVTQLAAPHAGLFLIAGTLLLAGFGFKISMVPFHQWTPDAYEGAPIPVAALLSVGPKAAGFAVLMRLFGVGLGPAGWTWMPLLIGLTIVTMTVGNLIALAQMNIKRLLAYSTIAQAGYLLIGLTVADRLGEASLWLYLVVYILMNCGAFAVVSAVTNATGSESLEAYRGLSQRSPGLSLVFAVFLLSLAGIPPLAGFIGKFYLFGAALRTQHVWLAVAGAVNSVVALAYYVKVIRYMYLDAPADRRPIPVPWALGAAAGAAVAGTVAIGLYPAPLLRLIDRSLPFVL